MISEDIKHQLIIRDGHLDFHTAPAVLWMLHMPTVFATHTGSLAFRRPPASKLCCRNLLRKRTKLLSSPVRPSPTRFSYFIFKTRSFYRLSLICSLASEDSKQNELN